MPIIVYISYKLREALARSRVGHGFDAQLNDCQLRISRQEETTEGVKERSSLLRRLEVWPVQEFFSSRQAATWLPLRRIAVFQSWRQLEDFAS